MQAATTTTKTSKTRMQLRSFAGDSQSAKEFLENYNFIDNIEALDANYKKGEVEGHPWSGDYWAIRTGAAARRYLDPEFPGSTSVNTWQEAYDYYLKNPPAKFDIELLAPAEKYDLLVGDGEFTLTQANWYEGQRYNDRFGEVETWMGLCHGWAPASFMEPRPTQPVRIKSLNSASEQEIVFLPDDIKALASLKWANGINITKDFRKPATRFLGGRCDVKEPKTDPESGRIIDSQCFDLNPGAWHVVVTNQIAREKRPFIIDASYDYEVWNQPVIRYSYTYFDPKSMKTHSQLDKARVNLGDPEFNDAFKKFRQNPKAVSVVGVVMDVTYVVETYSEGRETDSEKHDMTNTVRYYYDLELDHEGRIVGGEWYQNKHPDFIWMPLRDSTSLNREDLNVKSKEDVLRIAPEASLSMVPLRYVLDLLLLSK